MGIILLRGVWIGRFVSGILVVVVFCGGTLGEAFFWKRIMSDLLQCSGEPLEDAKIMEYSMGIKEQF
jgi:ABC-type microcin C transport system permease subunit YejB